MSMQIGHSGIREATIEAVVIRADGTRENLGVIAYWHKNPLKRLWRWTVRKTWWEGP